MLGRLSELLSHQCIIFRITSLAYTGNQKSSKHSSDSNSKVPKPQLLGASFPGCNLKELEMALPMCICDVAEQTGHERNYRARLEPKRALEAHRTSEVSQSQSRTEEDVCIIKASVDRIESAALLLPVFFLVLFLVSFRLQNIFVVHL